MSISILICSNLLQHIFLQPLGQCWSPHSCSEFITFLLVNIYSTQTFIYKQVMNNKLTVLVYHLAYYGVKADNSLLIQYSIQNEDPISELSLIRSKYSPPQYKNILYQIIIHHRVLNYKLSLSIVSATTAFLSKTFSICFLPICPITFRSSCDKARKFAIA